MDVLKSKVFRFLLLADFYSKLFSFNLSNCGWGIFSWLQNLPTICHFFIFYFMLFLITCI